MTIQRLTENEFEKAFQLSCYAFQVKDPEEKRPFARLSWNKAISYGDVSSGDVLAKLELLPFTVNVYGKTMPMSGIAGVASYPEHRRKGLVKQLLAHALKTMRKDGQFLSYLAPFSVDFYRKYGWEITFDEMTFKLDKTQLPKPSPILDGQMIRVPFTDKRIRSVYEKKQSHGMLVREDWWWQRLEHRYSKSNTALYTDRSGAPIAYIVYQINENQFEIEELVYTKLRGLDALLSFIGQHDSMIDSAKIPATAADSLHYFLPDPKTKAETVPYFMARIVDAQAFLSDFPFLDTGSGSYTIQIEDHFAEWNNEVFSLSIARGKSSCHARTEVGVPSIKMSIQTMAGLMLGYRRPSFYIKHGLIEGDPKKIEAFVRHIPDKEPALIDFF